MFSSYPFARFWNKFGALVKNNWAYLGKAYTNLPHLKKIQIYKCYSCLICDFDTNYGEYKTDVLCWCMSSGVISDISRILVQKLECLCVCVCWSSEGKCRMRESKRFSYSWFGTNQHFFPLGYGAFHVLLPVDNCCTDYCPLGFAMHLYIP